ncbi:MAG: DoxX family protein [Myxococcota bacterium]
MDARTVGYWISTGLFCLALTGSGLGHLSGAMEEGMAHLGYAPYVSTILGTWKVLGVIALLAPGLPRLKEWAYAGFLFNLTGAAWSHLASGDGAGGAVAPAVLLGIMAASWWLRPPSRVLGQLPGLAAAPSPATSRG